MKFAPTNSARLSDQDRRKLARLEERLEYAFQDVGLLVQALSHRSYSADNNERLEFVGDAVLGYVVGLELYNLYHDVQEDVLSLMRSRLVMGKTLAEVGREIGLPEHIRLGSGELNSGGRQRDSIVADAFEAVIGAIRIDGGIEAAHAVIRRMFVDRMQKLQIDDLKDAKTRLQEILQGARLGLPVYSVEQVTGADHARRFEVCCVVDQLNIKESAISSSRRGAEQQAAAKILELTEVRKLG